MNAACDKRRSSLRAEYDVHVHVGTDGDRGAGRMSYEDEMYMCVGEGAWEGCTQIEGNGSK